MQKLQYETDYKEVMKFFQKKVIKKLMTGYVIKSLKTECSDNTIVVLLCDVSTLKCCIKLSQYYYNDEIT